MFQAAFYNGAEFIGVPNVELYKKTLQQILDEGLVFRFDMPFGMVYFASNKNAFDFLKEQGKTVQWLHDMFDGWRNALVSMGFPKDKPINEFTLKEMHLYNAALNEFAGAKVVDLPKA